MSTETNLKEENPIPEAEATEHAEHNEESPASEGKEQESEEKKEGEKVEEPNAPRTLELEWSVLQISKHPVEKLVEEFASYPDKHFEKTGFYTAIDPEGVPIEEAKKRLATLISEQKKVVADTITRVEEHIKSQREEIARALEGLKSEVESHEDKLLEYMEQANDLEWEREDLERGIDEIKAEIKAILAAIGQQSEDIIEKRIQALRKELNELVVTYEEISAKKSEINAKEFAANRQVFAERAERYQKLYEKAQERLGLVHAKLKMLPGLTSLSHQFLFWAGVGAAGGAGWFFSVYVVDKKLFASDFLSFFFTRLFSLSDGLGGQSGVSLALILLLCLVGVLVLTTALSWVGQKLLLNNFGVGKGQQTANTKKKGTKKDGDEATPGMESDLSLTFGEEEKNYYRTRISAGSFFTFWIQILPVAFLLGVLYILLTVSGTNSDEVDKLVSSISGHFMGTSIAFGVAGVVYIYIRVIIDRRLEKEKPDGEEGDERILRRNWELIAVVVAFLLSIVSLAIWPGQAFVAIFGFISISLITGIAIGYAVFYRGLVQGDQELKNEIVHISFAIDNCKRPRPLYIMGAEGQQFKYNYLLLMEQMYKLSQIRNMQAAEVLVGKEMASRINLQGKMPKLQYQGFKLIKSIRRLFGKSDAESELGEEEIATLSDPASSYFHERGLLYRSLKLELKNKKALLGQVDTKLESIRNERTLMQLQSRSRLKAIETRKTSLIEANERLDRLRISSVNRLEQERDNRIVALRDGFDLGLWHRANDVPPTPKYKFESGSNVTESK